MDELFRFMNVRPAQAVEAGVGLPLDHPSPFQQALAAAATARNDGVARVRITYVVHVAQTAQLAPPFQGDAQAAALLTAIEAFGKWAMAGDSQLSLSGAQDPV